MNKLISLFISVLLFTINFAWTFPPGNNTEMLPDVKGMIKSGEPEIYSTDNLYDYINGAADFYLSYNFQELIVQYYENNKKQSISVEIYRHSDPYNAFGIYSQERPDDGDYLKIGTQGYTALGILYFLKGRYYIKINGYDFENNPALLKSVAKLCAAEIKEDSAYPAPLNFFPEKDKLVNSETYFPNNFLSRSFLKSVFRADYQLSGNKFKLFILEAATNKDCRKIIQKYAQNIGANLSDPDKELYSFNDPHYGKILIMLHKNYLCGTLNLKDTDLQLKLLNAVKERINIL